VTGTQWQGEVLTLALEVAGGRLTMTCPPMDKPPEIGAEIEVFCDPAEVSLVPEDAERH
jgi:hypothetical protein